MNKYIVALSLFTICFSESASARCVNGQCGLPEQTQQTQYSNQYYQSQPQQYYQQQYYNQQQYYQSQPQQYYQQQNYPQSQPSYQSQPQGQYQQEYYPSYSQSQQRPTYRGRYYPSNPDYDKAIPEHDFTWGHRDRPYYYNDQPKNK
jgi:hypothetical protein